MAPCAILRIFNDVLLSYLMYSKVLKVDHFICKWAQYDKVQIQVQKRSKFIN